MNNDKRHINLEEDKHLKEIPFGVEDNYFKSLTENILNGAKAAESDVEFNLHLKQNKMQVPEGYFDSLSKTIEDKVLVSEENLKPLEVISINRKRNYRWVGIAASLLLLASIYFGISFNKEQDVLAEVSDEYLIEFLEDNTILNEEMMASITEIDMILDEIYAEETGDIALFVGDHPELDYDFEYYE